MSSEKKRFLLRLDADLYAVMEKWAADELRSVNAQMEFLLVEAARRTGRLQRRSSPGGAAGLAEEGKEQHAPPDNSDAAQKTDN